MSNNYEEIRAFNAAAANRAINGAINGRIVVMAGGVQPSPFGSPFGLIGPHNSFTESVQIVKTVYWIFSILKPFIHP